MNFLPLIISLLIILAIGGSTIFQSLHGTLWENSSLKGFINARQELWNDKEQRAYNKATEHLPKPPPTGTEPKAEEEKTERKKIYFRDKLSNHEFAKFNLSPLIHAPASETAKKLYEPAANLICRLYQNTPFWKKDGGLQYRILNALIKKGDRSFLELFPDDPDLSEIFYKMLKGTNTYRLETNQGFPPFLDFFRDDTSEKEKHVINFIYARTPILKALIGEDLTSKLRDLEAKENKSLTRGQFSDFISANPGKGFEAQNTVIFSFDQHEENPPSIGIDDVTGIHLKR